jgi:hypothetical protein
MPPPARTIATPPAEPVASTTAAPVAPSGSAVEMTSPNPPKPTISVAETPKDANAPADDAAEESGEDAAPEDSGPPEIDADHATDLLADMIAREEATSEDDQSLPNAVVQTLRKFDQETADANWSENAEQHIEATLDEWIGALPADAQAHIALIHVECRATLCQVLAADNDPASQDARAAADHDWQQAIASLGNQPWWHQLGFVDLSTQVSSADDHTLYMTYLLRETKAPPAPDAAPDTGEAGTVDGGG